jgi:uncharacterized membrane protein YczE
MLLQQGLPTQFTFTIGWVDLVILIVLIFVFFRRQMLFRPLFAVIVALYIIRLFPNEIIWLIAKVNELNGPAAFITIGR